MIKMRVLLVVLTLLGSVVLFGGIHHPRAIPEVAVLMQGNIMKVIYDRGQPCHAKVTIHDAEGNSLFTETIRMDDGFVRPYDLSLLPFGEYNVEVKDDNYLFSKNVSYEDKTKLIAHVVQLKDKDHTYLVSVPVEGVDDEVKVTILDDRENVMHEETLHVSDDFARLYRIENMNVVDAVVFHISNKAGASNAIRIEP